MVDRFGIDTDWKAAISSEIFREYVANELKKEAYLEQNKETIQAQDVDDALNELDAFEKKLAADPELMKKFKRAWNALVENPQLAEKVDPNFVNGLKLLKLDEQE